MLWSLLIIVQLVGRAISTDISGLYDLAHRQLGDLATNIEFNLVDSLSDSSKFDEYEVTQSPNTNQIVVSGTTKSALATGLYEYLKNYGHVSISWTDSTIPNLKQLPALCSISGCTSIKGSAVVPYRYHFNTVTFGYTTVFYSWQDWEHLLDWASMHSINLPLAWVGYEQTLIDVLRGFNFTDDSLSGFLSGPAFQAWNRFGNIQGCWNDTLDFEFPKQQMELQKKIVERMVELGMTPILPSFTGFVPREITELYPNAQVVNSSNWNDFPTAFTNVTFLEPFDPLFGQIQSAFLEKQMEYLGNVSHFYTLDQYNENVPFSGDLDYLKEIAKGTVASLRESDSEAIWVMQGWMFFYDQEFWSQDKVESYLSGVEKGQILILDLYTDHSPVWTWTSSYYGHDFIINSLHNFGGNQGLEGSLQVLTQNFTEAILANPSNLVGVGLAMEGQEGNQIAYDIVFDQAWSKEPLDLDVYTRSYITARYGPEQVSEIILDAWVDLIELVYTNDQSTGVFATVKSIYEQIPRFNDLLDHTGDHSTLLYYDPKELVKIWKVFVNFYFDHPHWGQQTHFHNDLVDLTRQVLSNRFIDEYKELIVSFSNPYGSVRELEAVGSSMVRTMLQIDDVLYTDENFLLSTWISKAKDLASDEIWLTSYEFQARNQITIWGLDVHSDVHDYASKQWAGLVSSFFVPRWQKFVEFLTDNKEILLSKHSIEQLVLQVPSELDELSFDSTEYDELFAASIDEFEKDWQWQRWGERGAEIWTTKGVLYDVLKAITDDF